MIQQILVGDNAPWYSFDPAILQVELAISRDVEQELRNVIHELLAQIKIAKINSSLRPVRAELESDHKWKKLIQELTARDYDDIVLWLEELIDA